MRVEHTDTVAMPVVCRDGVFGDTVSELRSLVDCLSKGIKA